MYADRSESKVTESGDWNTLGMRGASSIAPRLSGEVSRENLVGVPGRFREVAIESFIPLAHLGRSVCWLGAVHGAFSQLIGHLRGSGRGGGPDLSSDLVRERLARIRLDSELVHAYLGRVSQEVAEARSQQRSMAEHVLQIHLNSLKLAASDLSLRAVDRMIDLAGLGIGNSRNSPIPLERCFRDLRSASLNYSTDRLWTANGALILMDQAVRLA
ncbi:acyl-CoA dehydrogenase family protein [Streptosporangium sp. NPDC002721]|uniref:acyl-CoA dehydrogenase family protein n=1 Tax=Streptosporangium sp. NPDC002721 TaxID=3366188 RepID=UPI0036893893